VFGTTSGYSGGAPYSHSDYCIGAGIVNEYYCSGTSEQSVNQSCGTDGYNGGNYCLSGDVYRNYTDYSCASGACSSSGSAVLQQDCVSGQYCSGGQCLWPTYCEDSDGGIDLPVAGTISGFYGGYPYSYPDLCNGTTTLIEYYCTGNLSMGHMYDCALMNYTGCASGACY
jgi:hypothetical protein